MICATSGAASRRRRKMTAAAKDLVFTEDGRFIYLYTRSDLPKIASNSRATTTPQEGAEISQGSIATYGTYTFADKTVMKGSGLLSGPSGPATKAPY